MNRKFRKYFESKSEKVSTKIQINSKNLKNFEYSILFFLYSLILKIRIFFYILIKLRKFYFFILVFLSFNLIILFNKLLNKIRILLELYNIHIKIHKKKKEL